MATSRPKVDASQPDRMSQGLPEDGVVFATFKTHYKFDPDTFNVCMALLAQVPGSVLWLLRGSDRAMANLCATAWAQGIDPRRLIFADKGPHGVHLARHSLADIGLDCCDHTGGVSILDALWASVPLISTARSNHSARTRASILHAASLGELAVADMAAYHGKGPCIWRKILMPWPI